MGGGRRRRALCLWVAVGCGPGGDADSHALFRGLVLDDVAVTTEVVDRQAQRIDVGQRRVPRGHDTVEDTDDLAEISLDRQRNALIKIDLVISNATLAVGVFGVVAGAFGMNLPVPLRSDPGGDDDCSGDDHVRCPRHDLRSDQLRCADVRRRLFLRPTGLE